MSHGGQTRPVPQPTTTQKDMFDQAVASSNLASSSEGLQALLRDHPELVSSSLSRAAGPGWSELSESTRGSRGGSQPGTPGEEGGNEGHILKDAPHVGEGGASQSVTPSNAPNLGSTGESLFAACLPAFFFSFFLLSSSFLKRTKGKGEWDPYLPAPSLPRLWLGLVPLKFNLRCFPPLFFFGLRTWDVDMSACLRWL